MDFIVEGQKEIVYQDHGSRGIEVFCQCPGMVVNRRPSPEIAVSAYASPTRWIQLPSDALGGKEPGDGGQELGGGGGGGKGVGPGGMDEMQSRE